MSHLYIAFVVSVVSELMFVPTIKHWENLTQKFYVTLKGALGRAYYTAIIIIPMLDNL